MFWNIKALGQYSHLFIPVVVLNEAKTHTIIGLQTICLQFFHQQHMGSYVSYQRCNRQTKLYEQDWPQAQQRQHRFSSHPAEDFRQHFSAVIGAPGQNNLGKQGFPLFDGMHRFGLNAWSLPSHKRCNGSWRKSSVNDIKYTDYSVIRQSIPLLLSEKSSA